MAKRKGIPYEEKMINALKSLPDSIDDKRHQITIRFLDDRARSNQSRFGHIIDIRHELKPSDIKRIPKGIRQSIFKKDKERTETFNLYIKRNGYSGEYIKISLKIEKNNPREALVKTVFITKTVK
ncbi:MAG: hypothetical protein J6038_04090 [Bacilli bacterium]|nr:hypothetical protein [Bacilli bacterium]